MRYRFSIIFFSCFFSLFAYGEECNFINLKGVNVSALIVNLNSQKTLAQCNSSARLSPASVSKLVIGAQALETYGSQKTFQTKIFRQGEIVNNILYGNLIFYGVGDPYLTNEKLWFLTTDVKRAGINKVTGKIIVNNSLFGNIRPDGNRLSGQRASHNAYDSPLSSAAVNFSVLAIVVAPGQEKGKKAVVSLEPYAIPSVKIINNVVTSSSSTSDIMVSRVSSNGQDIYTVSGHIGVHASLARVYRSVSNANLYAGEVVQSFLNSAGVATSGQIEVETQPLKNTNILISQVDSFPLGFQLKGLFSMSNNFIADMLTLQLSAPHGQQTSLQNSAQVLQNYMNTVVGKESAGASPLVLNSGGGLTPENRLSAKDVVALLSRMYSKSNEFPEFLEALAVPGAEGTLKNRLQGLHLDKLEKEENFMVRAKTGTLTEPLLVAAMAGYARTRQGDWVAFAILLNSTKSHKSWDIVSFRNELDQNLLRVLSAQDM